jgi:hypothetical protein
MTLTLKHRIFLTLVPLLLLLAVLALTLRAIIPAGANPADIFFTFSRHYDMQAYPKNFGKDGKFETALLEPGSVGARPRFLVP